MEYEDLRILIIERTNFENEIFDFLINPLVFVPPDDPFWDPVTVNLNDSQINQLKTIEKEAECFICTNISLNFSNLNCCNNDICSDCTFNWFSKSVKCPFCKQDLRDFI